MSAPTVAGPSPRGGGLAPSPMNPPTLEQLLILVARAERKGGLDHAEGSRLRLGLRVLAGQVNWEELQGPDVIALRRKYDRARKKAWVWKRRAEEAGFDAAAVPPEAGPDEAARDALRRVVELATRWTHIPAKRQAGASVLSAISNRDVDAA